MKKQGLLFMFVLFLLVSFSCVSATATAIAYKPLALGTYGGHTYAVYDVGMTWPEAKAFCESLNGHLATISSQEEQEVIASLIAQGTKNHYWLGATDAHKARDWAWVTGESFSYSHWDKNQPDNGNGGKEHYLQIYRRPNPAVSNSKAGFWNNIAIDCSYPGEESFFSLSLTGLICEWEKPHTFANNITANKYCIYVIDENGNPLQGATVTWNDSTETTGTDGTTLFPVMTAGTPMIIVIQL